MKVIDSTYSKGIVSLDATVEFEDEDGVVRYATVRDMGESVGFVVADRPWTNSTARDLVVVDQAEGLTEAEESRYWEMYQLALERIVMEQI